MKVLCGFISGLLCLVAVACNAPETDNGERERIFVMPEVPDTLVLPEARASYLALHYWDNYDFTDTVLISMPEITEQAFANFAAFVPLAENSRVAIDTLLNRASLSELMLTHFAELGEKYFGDPNSPMRNENLYIAVLESLIANPAFDDAMKMRSRYLLDLVMKNRPGDVAADFDVICRDGKRMRLSDIKTDYTLLFFNDPDCEECKAMKDKIIGSKLISEFVESGKLTVFSICVEGATEVWRQAEYPTAWVDACDEDEKLSDEQLYDLRAIPTLYLLDSGKKVLLKDAAFKELEAYISGL